MVGVLLVTMLAPIAAMLVQAAISRSREFEADRAGAEITGRPMWLASALGQIERAAQHTPNYPADANPATAHMFIINPLHGGISGLFATHPSTEERIARLTAMAGRRGCQSRKGPSQDGPRGVKSKWIALACERDSPPSTGYRGAGNEVRRRDWRETPRYPPCRPARPSARRGTRQDFFMQP